MRHGFEVYFLNGVMELGGIALGRALDKNLVPVGVNPVRDR
jgi:hypothetical protein